MAEWLFERQNIQKSGRRFDIMNPGVTALNRTHHEPNVRTQASVKNMGSQAIRRCKIQLFIFLFMLAATLGLLHQATDSVQARYVPEQRIGFTIRTPASGG